MKSILLLTEDYQNLSRYQQDTYLKEYLSLKESFENYFLEFENDFEFDLEMEISQGISLLEQFNNAELAENLKMTMQEAEENFKKIEELLKIFKAEILQTVVAFKMEKEDQSTNKLVEDKKTLMKRLQFYWRHLPPLKTRWLAAKDRVMNLISSIQICLAELSRKRQSFTHINDLV